MEDFECRIWNTEETRWGVNASKNSVTDLTLSAGGTELNWLITGDAHHTGQTMRSLGGRSWG